MTDKQLKDSIEELQYLEMHAILKAMLLRIESLEARSIQDRIDRPHPF